MSKRRCNNLISAWMRFTENSESPTRYHRWAAISVISGVLQRRVYMRWGHTSIFPNQYIVLIGPSGRARKGEPIEIAKHFIENTCVTLVGEAISRQKLIRRMKESFTVFPSPQMGLSGHSSITGIFGEFAAFLGEGDHEFLVDLTDWYDSRDSWKYDTKHSGTDDITGVCVNILGAMAPDWIPLCIPRGAVGGGFTSRILWVVASQKAKIVADPDEFPVDQALEAAIMHDLERISMINGEMVFSQSARDAYTAWYKEEEAKIKTGNPAVRDPRFSGYVARRATHLKKVAMTVSLAKSDERVISEQDFNTALEYILDIEQDMEGVFSRIGLSPYTIQAASVREYIKAKERIPRSEVLRYFASDLDLRTFEAIETYLEMTKEIKIIRDLEKKDTIYVWSG